MKVTIAAALSIASNSTATNTTDSSSTKSSNNSSTSLEIPGVVTLPAWMTQGQPNSFGSQQTVKKSKINPDPSKPYVPPPDPIMKLKQLSSTGVLHFEFNQPFIVPFNLTYINETVLNITIDILPTDERQFFNFTWNVTKYTENLMDL